MVCEECQARPATVYVTTISNGRRRDQHLCEGCARQKGEFDFLLDGSAGMEGMVAGLAGLAGAAGHTARPVVDAVCPRCGTTFGQFAKTSLLGCPECYAAMQGPLAEVVQRIQGQTMHAGKAPSRRSPRVRSQSELRRLRERLAELIRLEQYEQAAGVRDRIRALEAEAAADREGGGA
jgi:protein arginine kinase activator